MPKEPKTTEKTLKEIFLIQHGEEFSNEITVTKRDVSVTVSTAEDSERAMKMIHELMDKYGKDKQ